MRVKVTGVVPPINLIAPSLDLGLTVVSGLTPGVLVDGQAWATLTILQLLGGWLFMGMSLDYEN